MNIEIGSRAYRVFVWALGICGAFNNEDYIWKFQDGTNLCHYCRVIFFYMPLIFLAQIFIWFVVASAILFLPFYLWGFFGWGEFVSVIVSAVFLIAGIIWLGKNITIWNYERQQRKIHDEPKKDGHPSQVEIIREWILAKKSKICPEIRFVKGKEAAQ